MKIGIAMFPNIDAPAPGRLGRMIKDRGWESLWFAEHSHLPIGIDRAEGRDGGDRYAKTFDPVRGDDRRGGHHHPQSRDRVCLVPQRDPR